MRKFGKRLREKQNYIFLELDERRLKEKEFKTRRLQKKDEQGRILEGQKIVLKELETTNGKDRKSGSKKKD